MPDPWPIGVSPPSLAKTATRTTLRLAAAMSEGSARATEAPASATKINQSQRIAATRESPESRSTQHTIE